MALNISSSAFDAFAPKPFGTPILYVPGPTSWTGQISVAVQPPIEIATLVAKLRRNSVLIRRCISKGLMDWRPRGFHGIGCMVKAGFSLYQPHVSEPLASRN